jgi:hypothetical protein
MDLILYLAIQHSETVASRKRYIIPTHFPRVIEYTIPIEIQGVILSDITDAVGNGRLSNYLLTGTTNNVPIRINEQPCITLQARRYFMIQETHSSVGVWKLTFGPDRIITSCTKVVGEKEWTTKFGGYYPEHTLTNVFLLNSIANVVKNNGDDFKRVEVGIIGCESPLEHDEIPIEHEPLPQLRPNKTLFIKDKKELNSSFIPVYLPLNPSVFDGTPIRPLAGQYRLGCGLNILSLYGIINKKDAEGRICTTSMMGTSIFSMFSLISEFLPPTVFLIIRFSLDNAIRFMLDHILQPMPNDYGIIVKLYSMDKISTPTHHGHSISISRHDGEIYKIDPHVSPDPIKIDPLSLETLSTAMTYPTRQFVDVVFKTEPGGIPSTDLKDIIAFYSGTYIFNVDINHGGTRKRKRKTKRVI